MEDVYLNYVCFAILTSSALFAAVSLPLNPHPVPGIPDNQQPIRAEAEGVWEIMLVVFLVYGMLPLKTAVALGAGVALPALHLAVSAAFTHNDLGWKWQQVSLDKNKMD
jgi:hypothetical protein